MFLSMFWVENGNDKQVRPEPIISLKIKKTKTVALIPFKSISLSVDKLA